MRTVHPRPLRSHLQLNQGPSRRLNTTMPAPPLDALLQRDPRTYCQASPTLSDCRRAGYIPETAVGENRPEVGSQRELPSRPVQPAGTLEICGSSNTQAAAATSPDFSLIGGRPLPTFIIGSPSHSMSSPALSRPPSPAYQMHASSVTPRVPVVSSPRRPCAPPSTPRMNILPKLQPLSTLSLTSLPFPLPTPPVRGSDIEWDIDPFASATSYVGPLQSKWTSLGNFSEVVPINPDKRRNVDITSPAKMKRFFERISIRRSPTASGSHPSNNKDGGGWPGKKSRPDSLMTFVPVDEQTPGPLITNTFTQNDGADVAEKSSSETTRNLCPVVANSQGRKYADDVDWNSAETWSSTSVSSTSQISSPHESIARCRDGDGGAVDEDCSISSTSASIQPSRPASPHAPSSPSTTMKSYSAKMHAPSSPTSMCFPGSSHDTRCKSHSKPARALAIPPSPRTPPPHPPNFLPPNASDPLARALDLGFPSPSSFTENLPAETPPSVGRIDIQLPRRPINPPRSPMKRVSPPSASVQMSPLQIQKPGSATGSLNSPPTIPPRSKFRPPPVKITAVHGRTRRIKATQDLEVEQCDVSTHQGSPSHSRSSSIASLVISPFPTPPHSPSSSIASFTVSPMPIAIKHSRSSSMASSAMISPMPTPPSLSPTSPLSRPGSPVPCVPPEPQVDAVMLSSLILQTVCGDFTGSESDDQTEVAELEGKKGAEKCDDGSSTCTVRVPEFAWEEEPRAPPSRLSFYTSPERNVSSDIDDEDDDFSVYSLFTSTYTFRSRSNSTRRRRSVRRRNSNTSRRSTATSMMSIYSQASLSLEDTTDLPPVPELPWSLGGNVVEDVAEEMFADLGELTVNAPEHAYTYSPNDYVSHGLERVALSGRAPTKSGAVERQLPVSRQATAYESGSLHASDYADDWRALLSARYQGKAHRRTSSNISVVIDAIPVDSETLAASDTTSSMTYGSMGVVARTSSIPPPTLVPNRRQKTIRRVATTLPFSSRSNSKYQRPNSTSSRSISDAAAEKSVGGVRDGIVPFPYAGPDDKMKQGRGKRPENRGVRSRVKVLRSRLASLTLAPRSASTPFPTERVPELSHPAPNIGPLSVQWSSALVSTSASSPSSSSAGSTSMETSPPSSVSSPWISSNGDVLYRPPCNTVPILRGSFGASSSSEV